MSIHRYEVKKPFKVEGKTFSVYIVAEQKERGVWELRALGLDGAIHKARVTQSMLDFLIENEIIAGVAKLSDSAAVTPKFVKVRENFNDDEIFRMTVSPRDHAADIGRTLNGILDAIRQLQDLHS